MARNKKKLLFFILKKGKSKRAESTKRRREEGRSPGFLPHPSHHHLPLHHHLLPKNLTSLSLSPYLSVLFSCRLWWSHVDLISRKNLASSRFSAFEFFRVPCSSPWCSDRSSESCSCFRFDLLRGALFDDSPPTPLFILIAICLVFY